MIFRHIWHIWRYKQISQGEAQGTGTNRGTPWGGNSICAVHTEDRWSSASYPPPFLLKVSEMCLIITQLIVICLRLMLLKSTEVGSLSAQISMDKILYSDDDPLNRWITQVQLKSSPFVIFYLYSTTFLFCVSLWLLLLLSKFKIISKGFIL